MSNINLELTDDTVIRLTVNGLKSAPRYAYVVKTLEKAKELFTNAYIIPFVKWYKIPSIFFQLTGKDTNYFEDLRYSDARAKRSEVSDWKQGLRESLGNCYTVIPFVPIEGITDKVTDWKVHKNFLDNTSGLFNSYGGWRAEQKEFLKILLENGNAMGVILKGVYYSNPCEFCKLIFNRISGECEIFNTKAYATQTCQPRITFGAHLFIDDTKDIGTQIDYSLKFVNDIWEENVAPLEV